MDWEENGVGVSRGRYRASIEGFMHELRARLAETPSGKLTDTMEQGMVTSGVMRSYDIWAKALASGAKDESFAKFEKLKKAFRETVGE